MTENWADVQTVVSAVTYVLRKWYHTCFPKIVNETVNETQNRTTNKPKDEKKKEKKERDKTE